MPGLQKNQVNSDFSPDQIQRYSRHMLLEEVGVVGQRKLRASSVLVVGTGGLGSPVSMYLAAAGIGRIGLIDPDIVDITNLQRQIMHSTSKLGKRKVESAHDRLLDLNPEVHVDIYDEAFNVNNALKISQPYDVIIDASDNFSTRYLINDLCALSSKPMIYGSVFRFEGQASVFWTERGPCYRCIFPAPPPDGVVPGSSESGVFNVVPGVIGTIQATETLKIILEIGETLIGRLLIYDSLSMRFEDIRLKKNPRCKICSQDPEITQIIETADFYGHPGNPFGNEQI